MKLVTTSLIILKRNLMTIKEIRAGINAFILMEKELQDPKDGEGKKFLPWADKKGINIPLNEFVIMETFSLIGKTVSEELVTQWIKKNRPFLECEKKERKEFERHVKAVERDLKTTKGMTYPDDKDSQDRLFIHEFLFLLCNGRGKIEMIPKLPKPEFTIERKSIKQYDMQALDAIRLDRIFKLEQKDMGATLKKSGI